METRIKTMKTWRLKTVLQARRQKHALKNKDKTIKALTDRVNHLKTEITDMETDNAQNSIDFDTIKDRLNDCSCPWCGTPAPQPARTETGTQTPRPAHRTETGTQTKCLTPW
jgi:hypothetical protein